jgi:putative PIN family toxin of toxin-antitoxin system
MRIVLDTNILCSALLTPGGSADRLYRAWRERVFDLVTSAEQLDEFRRVTRYPKLRRFIDHSAAGTMHNELRRLAVLLPDLPIVEVSLDPSDNFLLAMLKAGQADFLVSGDKHGLLSMGTFEGSRIVTARQMLTIVGPVRRGTSKSATSKAKRRN